MIFMKVILLQDIPKLGRKSEVKEVSDGYARNFLFSRNLAKPATDSTLKELSKQKEIAEKNRAEEQGKIMEAVEKLKSLVLNFKVKIGEKGKAFGSVTGAKIAAELKKKGIEVEKEAIDLKESIKTMGKHTVKIEFPQNIQGEVKIAVEKE